MLHSARHAELVSASACAEGETQSALTLADSAIQRNDTPVGDAEPCIMLIHERHAELVSTSASVEGSVDGQHIGRFRYSAE